MGAQKFRKRMAKLKIVFLSIALCWTLPLQAYDIDELVKILIEKNENNSAFKFDDQIDDMGTVGGFALRSAGLVRTARKLAAGNLFID